MNQAQLVCAGIVRGCAAAISSASAQRRQPAPDPIVGTWRLNPAYTHTSGPVPILPPAQRVEEYRQTDTGHIALSITTTASDGTTTTSNMLFSARGGVVTQQNPSEGQMLVETQVAPGEWLVTYLAKGVQHLTMRKVVSPNGKTMRQTVAGLTPQGRSFEGLLVFDRQ